MIAQMFVYLQRLIPKHLLTALIYRLARIRVVPVKNFLIRTFIGAYKVDVEEIKLSVPDEFPTFNAFFTRELAPNARPIDGAVSSVVSPVDGTLSAAGKIENERIYQAKGTDYSLVDLLATDTPDIERYANGEFATIYLAPYNYHCVHAPLAGRVRSITYIPGDLFSVNRATVQFLPGLFARNERLVCHCETDFGDMAIIFVGAMNVGSITTRWTGELRPRKRGTIESLPVDQLDAQRKFDKGDLLGWFNMGSTVITLHSPGSTTGIGDLKPNRIVRVGEALGTAISQ